MKSSQIGRPRDVISRREIAADDSKLSKKDFRQFLRDLRDLAQMAERRISSRQVRVIQRVFHNDP